MDRRRALPLLELWRAARAWFEEGCLSQAAAVAYYSALSLTPFLVIALAVAGLVVDSRQALSHLEGQLAGLLGAPGAELVASMVRSASRSEAGGAAVLAAAAATALAASAAIAQLQKSMDALLGPRETRNGLATVLRVRLLAIAAALSMGFLIVVSLVLSAIAAALVAWARPSGSAAWLALLANELVSVLLVTVAFVALLRFLPGCPPGWRAALRGAFVAGLLFELAKFGIALYIESSDSIQAFGAAGSVVVFMLWVYYVSAIFLYGTLVSREHLGRKRARIAGAVTAPPAIPAGSSRGLRNRSA